MENSKSLKIILSMLSFVLLIGLAAAEYVDTGALTQSVNDCGITNPLNTTNAVYTLTQNVTSNMTCFAIFANNITLNGAGFAINFSANGTVAFGINVSANDTVIRDLHLVEGVATGNGKRVILLSAVRNTTILNTSIRIIGTSTVGIFSSSSSNTGVLNSSFLTLSESHALQSSFGGGGISLINSTIVSTTSLPSATGFRLSGGSDFLIINSTIQVAGGSALDLQGGSSYTNITVIGSNLTKTLATGTAGVISVGATDSNITIIDSILDSSSNNLLLSGNIRNGTWNFTNVTESNGGPINISWGAGVNGTLNYYWYLDVNVSNAANEAIMEGANVTVTNNAGTFQYSALTGSNGRTGYRALLQYTMNDSTGTGPSTQYFSNYTVNVTNTSFTSYTNSTINMTTNLLLHAKLSTSSSDWTDNGQPAQSVTGCGTLTTANAVYTLANNVTSNGTCFNIGANNITFNGAGYTVNYSATAIQGFGFNVSLFNQTTISNTSISEVNVSGNSNYAIYLTRSANSTIINNIIFTNGSNSRGIYVNLSGNASLLHNFVNTTSASAHAIYIDNSHNATIRNNTASTHQLSVRALQMQVSSYALIDSNNFYAVSGYASDFILSNNNRILNNNLSSSYNVGSAIQFTSNPSSHNTFINNTLITNGLGGIGIIFSTSCNNCSFSNMSVFSSSYPLSLQTQSVNNFTLNSVLLNSSRRFADIFLDASVNLGMWNFTNVTKADGSEINVSWPINANGTLNYHSLLDVNVSNAANEAIMEGANVTVTNNAGTFQYSALTGSNGRTGYRALLQYTMNGSGNNITHFSNYTVNVTNTSFTSYTNSTINMTTNLLLHAKLSTSFLDTSVPNLSIVYPSNTTYSINISSLNYTASDTNLSFCWYSLNAGTTNSSPVACGTNFTNLASIEGSNSWRVYANDSSGNLNTSSVTFFKDSIYPIFSSHTSNSNSFNDSGTANINVTITNANGTAFLQIDGANYTASNLTASVYNASVNLSSAGTYSYVWHAYGNGSLRNLNTSSGQSFIVGNSASDEESEGSSGSSSGGALHLLPDLLSKGYTRSYFEKTVIKFRVYREQHSLTLDKVTADSIEITLNSTPQHAVLLKGETKKFELNGDAQYDVAVTFNNGLNKVANLTLRVINETIPLVETANNNTAEPASPAEESSSSSERGPAPMYLIITIIIAAALILAVIAKMRKRRHHHRFDTGVHHYIHKHRRRS